MAKRPQVLVIAILFALIASPYVMSAQAHTAESFTILIKEDGFSHNNQQIIQNDSVIWYNIDNGSNLTHRLVYDYDGDGLYNGTFDWDSGELSAECERDENNTKLDENCTINFIVTLDMNWTVGNYTYQDIRSDGSVVNATIELIADTGMHTEANLPAIGSEFGVTNDDKDTTTTIENEDEGLTPENMLLLVGLFTGVSSVILLGILMLRRSNPKTLDNVHDESNN
ncbi:MAG: hypothetical protein CMA45_01535 [Euryarchaeota archaeon]|nr:hypothetical protein [Euryarchaeota archaeon]